MRPYAAYLRVYEPLSAFSEPEGRRWAEYSASPHRPRRAAALDAEQAEALGRLIATPPVAAPEQESGHAYVRWADGVTYICPWQTRLRSWLELSRLRAISRPLLSSAFAAGQADAALHDFAQWQGQASSLRVFIQAATWSVPAAWFVPFAAEERWLVLGGAGDLEPAGPASAAATRTLSYATAMSQARRRIARALNAVQGAGDDALTGQWGRLASRRDPGGGDPGMLGPWPAGLEIAQVGRWLEEFHPHSVVELDYGGLVHLLDDESLRADQSVAEVSAALSASREGQPDLAAVLYQRLRGRWQALESLEAAN
ncbi:MAG TPA: hypothetical protein VMH35_02805 [Streptosporangiaceae bacterium]|nr:hypothetical protein [Streptosporangiaceae bacterium]